MRGRQASGGDNGWIVAEDSGRKPQAGQLNMDDGSDDRSCCPFPEVRNAGRALCVSKSSPSVSIQWAIRTKISPAATQSEENVTVGRLSKSATTATTVSGMLSAGAPAPAFTLEDQDGNKVRLSSFKGRRVLVYFYPKADTPGCTQQSCLLRDIVGKIGDTVILGISPDPTSKQKKFADKYDLPFPLLADTEHVVAEKFGVWKQKSMYGRTYMGIERSAFLVGANGKIEHAWYKVSPKDTPTNLLKAIS